IGYAILILKKNNDKVTTLLQEEPKNQRPILTLIRNILITIAILAIIAALFLIPGAQAIPVLGLIALFIIEVSFPLMAILTAGFGVLIGSVYTYFSMNDIEKDHNFLDTLTREITQYTLKIEKPKKIKPPLTINDEILKKKLDKLLESAPTKYKKASYQLNQDGQIWLNKDFKSYLNDIQKDNVVISGIDENTAQQTIEAIAEYNKYCVMPKYEPIDDTPEAIHAYVVKSLKGLDDFKGTNFDIAFDKKGVLKEMTNNMTNNMTKEQKNIISCITWLSNYIEMYGPIITNNNDSDEKGQTPVKQRWPGFIVFKGKVYVDDKMGSENYIPMNSYLSTMLGRQNLNDLSSIVRDDSQTTQRSGVTR
ncbi:MAG: hypothetical protein P8L77_02585, partial [Gammaproteobacteria bacterium]|nr:hypothetical protein [Gammaproteobacteria bacterium]